MTRRAAIRFAALTPWLAAPILTAQLSCLYADWPAKQFQVVTSEPTTLEKGQPQADDGSNQSVLAGLWESAVGADTEWQAQAGEAAAWMNEIGGILRTGGHDPPYLEPIVQVNGVPNYRVYIFPYTGSRTRHDYAYAGGGYQLSHCVGSPEINWISYNADLIARNAPLPKPNYSTFAHELFHALQFGDRLMANCFSGSKWIPEGMADGIGNYLIDRKWPNYNGRINGTATATGLRHYDWPLHFSTGRQNVGPKSLELRTWYLTSSFWRFFADYFGGARVFPHFLDEPLPAKATGEQLLEWLDGRLRTEPNIQTGLYLAYPLFVTEFASYGGSRYTTFLNARQGTGESARRAWLDEAFTSCHEITLTPTQSTRQVPISIMNVAAICLRVRLEGFSGNVAEQLEVVGQRLDVVDQLHLGWAWIDGPDGLRNCYLEHQRLKSLWPPCLLKAYSQTGPAAGTYARTWAADSLDMRMSGAVMEKVYILSNVAELPWKTKEVAGYTLKVGIAHATSNNEPAEPVQQLPVRRKTAAKPPPRTVGKEELYGLQTDPPVPDAGVTGFNLNPYTPNRSEGAKAIAGGYAVVVTGMGYGVIGPVTGTVTWKPRDPRDARAAVASNLCTDGDQPIGRVVQSDENALRIALDADLCRADPGAPQECEGGCPVVDHVTAEVAIAFGWRSFPDTAPVDIRTPGIERYIATMPDSLEEALRFGAGSGIPDEATGPSAADSDSSSGSGSGTGSGTGTAGGLRITCDCSCAGIESMSERVRQMDASFRNGGSVSNEELTQVSACAVACQKEMVACATAR
jgi:hypothetical protein